MYQIRILYRLNGQLETYITRVTATKAAAKLYAKCLAQERDGRIVDVINVDELTAA